MAANTALLFFAATLVAAFLFDIHLPAGEGKSLWRCFVYQMCHCNIWHLLCNMWCVYMISRSSYRTGLRRCIYAYLISALLVIASVPTEGLSGVIFALLGMMSWQASRIRIYHAVSLACIGFGLLFAGSINVYLHLSCYLAGIAVEMLHYPWKQALKKYWK